MTQKIKYHLEYKPVLSFTIVDEPDDIKPIEFENKLFFLDSDQLTRLNAFISLIDSAMKEELTNKLGIPSKYLKK
jgi:hypothetical protein